MKKFLALMLVACMALAPAAYSYMLPDNYTFADFESDLSGSSNVIQETEIDTEAELETILTDVSNVIVSTEIDTAAELDALVADANLITEDEMDASSELAALIDDETGTGLIVFDTNPVVRGWAAENSANQACSTTCSTGTAIFGFDAGTNAFVDESSALADSCLCSIDN